MDLILFWGVDNVRELQGGGRYPVSGKYEAKLNRTL